MGAFKKIRLDYVVKAAIMIGIGLVLTVWAAATIDFIAKALAVLIISIGAIMIISYFRHKEKNYKLSGGFVAGVIIAAIGLWIFFNSGKFTDFIPKLFGVFILISGLENLGQTISLIKYKSKAKWASLLIAILTVGLGGFLLFNPTGAKEIAVTLLGMFLIFDGATNLINAVLVGAAQNRVEKEHVTIDAEAVIIDDDKDKIEIIDEDTSK